MKMLIFHVVMASPSLKKFQKNVKNQKFDVTQIKFPPPSEVRFKLFFISTERERRPDSETPQILNF